MPHCRQHLYIAVLAARVADAGCGARLNEACYLARPFSLASGALQEAAYQRHHLVELVFESKVSCVKQMELDIG
jgi:hypothetical protein